MQLMNVFCDLSADAELEQILVAGIAPHRLLRPAEPAKNVLSQSGPDPALREADIAFGQPDTRAVLEAPRLRWLQVSSAGYTRYDTAEFREGAAARGLILT
ncbi:D-2-hydroxyacid dehydrogenase, partial [bacterium]|nr:D-2-hydroxyacid dehydrogenase [bacterium]